MKQWWTNHQVCKLRGLLFKNRGSIYQKGDITRPLGGSRVKMWVAPLKIGWPLFYQPTVKDQAIEYFALFSPLRISSSPVQLASPWPSALHNYWLPYSECGVRRTVPAALRYAGLRAGH